MPRVPFDSLPPDARVWVFAADRPVAGAAAERLLGEVDRHLATWAAHGAPLTAARDWKEDRFLAVAVDQRTANASGCSIDGLFRKLTSLEREIGASLVGASRVHFRDVDGEIRSVERDEFSDLAASGRIGEQTMVFDPTVSTAGEWRERFEKAARESWHGALL